MIVDAVKRFIETIGTMSALVKLPEEMTVSFQVVYLGEVKKDDPFHLEIRNAGAKLGWLYSEVHVVLFSLEGKLHQCELAILKEAAQELLKAKVFISDNALPKINTLRRGADSSVEAWISFDEVLKISQEV